MNDCLNQLFETGKAAVFDGRAKFCAKAGIGVG
jgi:hypothetical protein